MNILVVKSKGLNNPNDLEYKEIFSKRFLSKYPERGDLSFGFYSESLDERLNHGHTPNGSVEVYHYDDLAAERSRSQNGGLDHRTFFKELIKDGLSKSQSPNSNERIKFHVVIYAIDRDLNNEEDNDEDNYEEESPHLTTNMAFYSLCNPLGRGEAEVPLSSEFIVGRGLYDFSKTIEAAVNEADDEEDYSDADFPLELIANKRSKKLFAIRDMNELPDREKSSGTFIDWATVECDYLCDFNGWISQFTEGKQEFKSSTKTVCVISDDLELSSGLDKRFFLV